MKRVFARLHSLGRRSDLAPSLRGFLSDAASPCLASGLLCLVFFLAGCTVGPDYQRPSALGTNSLPASFSSPTNQASAADWKPAEPAAHWTRGSWWTIFADSELDRLEVLATLDNQQIAIAAARFEQARASFDVSRADLFPHLSADPSSSRQRTSFNQPVQGQPAHAAHTYHTYTFPLDASWEADLWGRVRRLAESARARLSAAADDVEATRLAMHAEVATDYFAWRDLEAEDALLVQTIEAYRRSLELTRNRRAGGVVSDLDVAQAETQLRTAEAQRPPLALRRARLQHALAALCGRAATGFQIAPATNQAVALPPALPLLLPSECLERRPDIAAAERRMAAANADVGVAHAAFYPRVQIQGVAGFQSVQVGTWFDWPSRLWAVGPALTMPIFMGGRNRAQLAAAKAAYDETVARYRQTVLSAFQEVEDQLAAQAWLEAQLTSERAALASAQHAATLADNRYRSGLVTYLEVATAQNAALTRERTVVSLAGERLTATVALVKALGGGWKK